MPRTNKNQIFKDGVLVEETQVVIPDSAVFRSDAPTRARAAYPDLRAIRTEALADRDALTASTTAAEQRAMLKRTMGRQAKLARTLRDVLVALGMDDGSYNAADEVAD